MSGIEVVGIVLGAIPLVISGLGHYADGAATIKRIWYAASVFRELSRRLKGENASFRNTLSILLRDSVDPAMQKQLLEDTSGMSWKDANVHDALNARLRESLSIYLEYVQSICKSLVALKEKLYLGADGKVPFTDAVSFREAYKRFRFALKKSEYEGLIKDIHDDVRMLERLTEQTKTIQTLETHKNTRRLPDFDAIRSRATSIFESLQKGLHVTCSMPHKASLCLRSSHTETGKMPSSRAVDKEDTFRIVLHHQVIQPKCKIPPWSIEEAEVRLLQSLPSNQDALQAVAGAERKPSGGQTVSFQEPTQQTSPAPQVGTDQQVFQEIKDLCSSIETLRATQCGVCLGIVGKTPQYRHALYWPQKRLLDQKAFRALSLADVLGQSSSQTFSFSNKDAYRLAVSLATGMMRLHDTPWLTQDWTKNDITLITRDGKILAEHPFISATVDATLPQLTPQTSRRTPIRNQTLFALGIILIELCMKKPIDQLHHPDELNADGTKHDLSDFYAAGRIVDSGVLSDTLGPGWSKVVSRCIFCDPEWNTKPNLANIDFRKAVYITIVSELEDNCRQFFGIGIDVAA